MFQDVLYQIVFHNRVLDYLICFFTFLVGAIIIQIFKSILLNRLKAWTEKTSTTLDDFLIQAVKKQLFPLLYFGAFYLSIRGLVLSSVLYKSINILGLILLTIFGARFLLTMIEYSLKAYWVKKGMGTAKKQALDGIIMVTKVVVWGFAVIILLDNLGIKISALVAGLGIGGIAIALAAQAVLGDLFSYFTIFFDRPFEIDDFIIVGDYLGTVEHVGIKTTRVRSLSGEQLVFSNSDLTNSRLRNYKRMDKRRVNFKLGVTYETGLEQLKEIPTMIANIIKSVDDVVFDRAHFFSYGDFSLVFDVVYYVLSSDYNKYMDIQQEINFKIKEEFEKRKIEFAYPTQTLYLNKM